MERRVEAGAPAAGGGRRGPGAAVRGLLLRPALAIPLAIGLFFAPALSSRAQFVYRDTGRLHAPTKRYVAEELARGRLPGWNPYAGFGAPVVSGATDAVLHPFNLLLLALPFEAAFKAWILLSFLLAAAGGHAWARRLGASETASAGGGLVFALSGPLVSSTDNLTFLTTYAALPLVLAAVHGFVRAGGAGRLLLVGGASALAAAGGDPQAWGLATLLAPLYAVTVASTGSRRRDAGRGLLALGAAVVGAAPFVLPVMTWMGESFRAGAVDPRELSRWNLHPGRLAELLLPGLFAGDPSREPVNEVYRTYLGGTYDPLPWFLSIYAGAGAIALAAVAARRDARARWLLVLAIPFLWAALGPHAGFWQIARHLPVLGGFRFWEKLAVWPALLVSAAAALGTDALRSPAGGRIPARAAAASSALLGLGALAALGPGLLHALLDGSRSVAGVLAANLSAGAFHAGLVVLALAGVAWLAARGRPGRAAAAAAAVAVLDLAGANAGAYVLGAVPASGTPPLAAPLQGGLARVATPFSLREDRWPERGRLASTWEWGRRTLAPAWNVASRVGTPRSYAGLRDARLTRYEAAVSEHGRWTSSGLFGVGYAVVPGRLDLGERAGLSPPHRVAASDPELPAWLVAMPHRPRAYLAESVERVDEEAAFAFALRGGDPGRSVVEAPVPAGEGPPGGDVRLARDAPEEVALLVRADRPALLVLNDAWAPGWRAEVDGRPAPILRANYLVRGVWIEAGEHRVEFRHATPGLRAGWAILAAGLAALGGAALAARPRRRGAAP